MSRVVLVDSGGSNIGSVQFALQRLGVEAPLSSDADTIATAGRVILPGVGAAAPAMQRLHELGLVELLRGLEQPLLGVCVGMQILYERSEEGDVDCLGRLPGVVRRLQATPRTRVPHMGWNRLRRLRPGALLDGIDDGAFVYFVHGYAAPVDEHCVAASEHGVPFAAVVQHGTVCGAQFHPERSAAAGARLLENFLR
jgi:imidazole glycerol-phosphate synthase subunit HisH